MKIVDIFFSNHAIICVAMRCYDKLVRHGENVTHVSKIAACLLLDNYIIYVSIKE